MKVKLLALCLFFSCGVFSQYRYIKEEDLKLINIVQTKIKNDTIAYKHFLFSLHKLIPSKYSPVLVYIICFYSILIPFHYIIGL